MTEEKLAYLAEERAMIDETLGKQSMMQQAYVNEEITFDEYREYLSDYNYAYSRSELLTVIEKHASYLQQKEAEIGVKGWFIYDTGWQKMYSEDADLFLYAAILLLLTGSFAAEYVSKSSSGGFAQLLRSTKNGRHKTFYAKLISSGMIAVILALLTGLVDTAVIIIGYDLPAMNAPLVSMQMFTDVTRRHHGGTVFRRVLHHACGRRFADGDARLRPVGTAGTVHSRPRHSGDPDVLARTLRLLRTGGGTAGELPQSAGRYAPVPAVCEAALFGNGYAMLVLWLAVAVAAVTAMMMPAKRMFVK